MSFPRYPRYKPTGVTWIGEAPDHWTLRRFKLVLRERDQRSTTGEETLLSVSAYTGVSPRSEIVDPGETLTRADSLEGYKVCLKHDLVMNIMLAWNRGLGVTEYDGIVSPAYCVFLIKPGTCPKFLHYMLRSDRYIGYFKAFSAGVIVSRLRLYPDTFLGLSGCLPPLSEQSAIAAFLDRETAKIDALIAEQERLIELLKEKRQTVISLAVTRGLNPNAHMKPSGIEWLGDVPQHWEELPLRALFALKHGYPFDSEKFADSGKYVLMTPGNFNEKGGFRSKTTEKFYAGDIPQDFILEGGQLLVAMTEQAPGLLGSALFVPDGTSFLHNQRLGLVHKLRRDRLSERYLFYLLNSQRMRAEISVSSTGAKVKHTSPQKILSVKVLLPPLSEQEQIGSVLDEKTAKIDALEAEAARTIEFLEEHLSALISAAVTGQIDVRGLAEQKAA